MIFTPRFMAVISSVVLFGLTYGLSSPLIALKLLDAGMSESAIGVNAAMHALGVFAVAPFLPVLFRRFSPTFLITSSLSGLAVLFLLFAALPPPYWFLLRLGLGIFSEIIMVQTETWLNGTTVEQARGKVLAIYTAGMSLGFAAGPLIIVGAGSGGNLAFYITSALACFAALLVMKTRMPRADDHDAPPLGLRASLNLALLPILATLLNAAVEVLGMNFLSLYAMKLGWSEPASALLIAVLMFGAIVLQLPVGWLADKVSRPALMRTLAFVAAALAFVWPALLAFHLLAYAMLFLWGGIFVGIYTVAITWVGERFKGAQLTGIYAAMSVAWGLGALAGPLLGGVAMTFSRHGLPWITGLLCLLFALLSLHRRFKIHS